MQPVGMTFRVGVAIIALVVLCPHTFATDYWVVTRTGDRDGAGTNADVQIKLIGTKGESKWLVMDETGIDDRERDDANVYRFDLDDIGDVNRVLLRVCEESASPDRPDWYLERVAVVKGTIPREIALIMKAPKPPLHKGDWDQEKRKSFEKVFRKLPEAKEFKCDGWVKFAKWSDHNHPDRWPITELK